MTRSWWDSNIKIVGQRWLKKRQKQQGTKHTKSEVNTNTQQSITCPLHRGRYTSYDVHVFWLFVLRFCFDFVSDNCQQNGPNCLYWPQVGSHWKDNFPDIDEAEEFWHRSYAHAPRVRCLPRAKLSCGEESGTLHGSWAQVWDYLVSFDLLLVLICESNFVY